MADTNWIESFLQHLRRPGEEWTLEKQKQLEEERKRKQSWEDYLAQLPFEQYGKLGAIPEYTERLPGTPTAGVAGVEAPVIRRLPRTREEAKQVEWGIPPEEPKTQYFVPEGYEITGYDSKMNPIIRKIKSIVEQLPSEIFWSDATTKQVISAETKQPVTQVPPKAKIIPIPGSQQASQKGKDLENLLLTIGNMKGLLDKIPSAEGFMGRAVGVIERGKALVGYNKELKIYTDYKKVILGQIVRTIGGETGSRISDQDVIRMQKALPSEFETTSERQMKWKLFGNITNEVSRNYGGSDIFDSEGNIIKIETKQQFSIGTTKTKNGKIYIYRGNNQWEEQ